MRTQCRAFASCAALFLVAGSVVFVVRIAVPFDRGWWLAAYLVLVGCVAQLLLGRGLLSLARRADAGAPDPTPGYAELVLWNVGTVGVAVADLSGSGPGVLMASVVLLVALAMFARDLHQVHVAARRPVPRWELLYGAVIVLLALSVGVGTGLAGALPVR